ISAANLARAIKAVKQVSGATRVNLVAHSFGGLLTRTYLQDRAAFGQLPYGNDVGRLMTLGTPHQGIGGPFTTLYADVCAGGPGLIQPLTCFQVNTGNPTAPGEGVFLKQLNGGTLPVLDPGATPQYYVIKGRQLSEVPITDLLSIVFLQQDD